MANTTNPRRNAEGYPDPTAYEALKNIDREEDERFHRLLHTLFYLCELAGFEIEGRIILIDKRNGRVWRHFLKMALFERFLPQNGRFAPI